MIGWAEGDQQEPPEKSFKKRQPNTVEQTQKPWSEWLGGKSTQGHSLCRSGCDPRAHLALPALGGASEL